VFINSYETLVTYYCIGNVMLSEREIILLRLSRNASRVEGKNNKQFLAKN